MEILSQIKFNGTAGTVDQALLSNGGTLLPAWETIATGGAATTPYAETPTGALNGTNTAFTLANTPTNGQGVLVFLDGVFQYNNGIDFTVTGNTINFVTAPAATTGSIFAVYGVVSGGGGGITASSTDTLTNKSIALGTNTITGTKAQFDTAVTDGNFLYVGDITQGVTTMAAIGATPNANGASISTNTLTLQPANASFGGVVTTLDQTFAGNKTFEGNLQTPNLNIGTSIYASNNTWGLFNVETLGTYTLAGVSSSTIIKTYFQPAGTTILDGRSLANNIFSSTDAYTEAATGVHNIVSQIAIEPIQLNNGGATTTNGATLYIKGAATGTATITNNYSLWVDSGATRLDGALELQGIASATKTDILYYDTTTKAVSYGAAPAGGSGSGITRSIITTAVNTTAGAAALTDYIYLVSNTTTITMPTAVGNTNRYVIKNMDVGNITINTTSSQTIDDDLTVILTRKFSSIALISNGSGWSIIT